jgi:hypothetical protein
MRGFWWREIEGGRELSDQEHTFSLFDLMNWARMLEMVDKPAACKVVARMAVGIFESSTGAMSG